MSSLRDASIGIWSFIPSPHPTDKCGTNGLPLTPNSIVVMGRFESLKTFYHENICQYLDIVRAKHERLIVAEEYHENNLYKLMQEGKSFSNEELTSIMFDTIQGLAFLNSHGIVSRNVSPNNIVLDSKGKAKHSKFGLYHITSNGSLVSFPIGTPKYIAPEVIASGPGLSPVYGPSSYKVDVWSVGMVLLDLIMGGSLWQDVDECNEVQKIFEKIFTLVKRQKETFEHCLNILINDHKVPEKLQNIKPEIISFLKACLTVKPSERPSAVELLNHEMFSCFDKNKISLENGFLPFPSVNRSVGIELSDLRNEANKDFDEEEDHLAYRYRMGRAYFSPESAARTSCITCRDILNWMCCFSSPEEHVSNRPLTLADLVDTQPEYACNVTVNNWRKTGAEGETDFEVLSFSPKEIQRLDRRSDEKEFNAEGFMKPRDVKLSTAMTASAAVLSFELGGIQGSDKPFRLMRILLGLGLGTSIVTQPELTMTWCSKVLPLIVQLFLGMSTTVFPIVRYFENDLKTGMVWETIGTMIFACLVFVLILIAVIPTGAEHPGLIERFARPLNEVHHLWCLAGGDVEGELKKQGLIKTKAPILSLPNVFLNTGVEMGAEKDKILLLDETTISLSLSQLRERLKHVGLSSYYPLIEENDPASRSAMLDIADLPLVIRERTVDYQFHRIVLFQRLLLGYPYTRDRLVREARTDIPPFLRGKIWAGLLGVQGDTQANYDNIDKESPCNADRQIEVDIPRCHQYDPLLSSPTAHEKFKRVLKAWVVSHPHLGYWQGLDSLCAPFLSLHFNDEALAYACMSAFVPKYLHNFFLKDNAPIIQEYLAVFSQLIAFHDPELFSHMGNIGFIPELYAIPWFLTMFCHVFPLHKIYHLWDTLLLGNSSFPLCIGVAILQQLRDQLLSFGFNECILLFSDMPGIDIDRVVRDSKKIFSWTPRTASLRRHEYAIAISKGKPEKDFLPLKHLKEEVCPRITAQDVVHIMELGNNIQSWTIGSPKKNAKPRGIVMDVRAPEEFHRGHIPGSVNIPFNQAFLEDGALAESTASNTLATFKGKIVIVMGTKTNYPAKIGAELVKLSFPRVCVLEEQGIAALRSMAMMSEHA